MNKDEVIGTAKNLGGKAQDAFGKVTGDTKSQVERGHQPGGRSGAGSRMVRQTETASDAERPPGRGGCSSEVM